jgi:DNA topoisomerase VI subunit A
VLALDDGDIDGFEILTVYGKGSKQMAYNGESLITPNILWLGVRPSDSKNYDIPEKCMKSLSDKELKYLGRLVKKPRVREHDGWMKELNIMLKTKQKIDIHATNVKWLVETYLSTKLKFLDWLE